MSTVSFLVGRFLRAERATPFVSFLLLVATLGVMLGTASLNVALSVIQGFERRLEENIVAFTAEIEVQGFRHQPLRDWRRDAALLRDSVPGVRAAAPFAAREVIVRGHGGIEGVFLKGVVPDMDITGISRRVVEGSFVPAAPARPPVVLGRRLAGRLGVGVGDSILVIPVAGVPDVEHPVRVSRLQVVGLYETGFSEYDDIYVYTDLATAQHLLDLPADAASGFDVRTHSTTALDTRAARIEEVLGYPAYARTMYDMYPTIFAWIDLQKKPVPIVLGLITIVAAFNIVATILMIVLEKTHAVGILKTLGATRREIRALFIRQGAVVALAGVTGGDALGYALCWMQQTWHIVRLKSDVYFMSVAPIDMRWTSFLLVSVLAFLLCLAAAALPAGIAARLRPVRALRFS